MTVDYWSLIAAERQLRILLIQTYPHRSAGNRRDGVNVAVIQYTRRGIAERARLFPDWTSVKVALLRVRRKS